MQVGSILLGTTRPAELRDWYRKTLAPDHEGDGPISFGDLVLVIDERDDVAPKNDEPGRVIINFHVDDFAAARDRLEQAGVEWTAPPEERPFGHFATFADPDGNYLQIVQLKPHN
jgi:uncharacterized glyoxalase superfamily protein PhnB